MALPLAARFVQVWLSKEQALDIGKNSRKAASRSAEARPARKSDANPLTRIVVRDTRRHRNARKEILPELLGCHFFG